MQEGRAEAGQGDNREWPSKLGNIHVGKAGTGRKASRNPRL